MDRGFDPLVFWSDRTAEALTKALASSDVCEAEEALGQWLRVPDWNTLWALPELTAPSSASLFEVLEMLTMMDRAPLPPQVLRALKLSAGSAKVARRFHAKRLLQRMDEQR